MYPPTAGPPSRTLSEPFLEPIRSRSSSSIMRSPPETHPIQRSLFRGPDPANQTAPGGFHPSAVPATPAPPTKPTKTKIQEPDDQVSDDPDDDHDLPEDQEPTIEPSRSGLDALARLQTFSDVPVLPSMAALAVVFGSADLKHTDPDIFNKWKREVHTLDHLVEKLRLDKQFSDRTSVLTAELAMDRAHRSCLERYLQYVITQRNTSMELGVKLTVFFATEQMRACTTITNIQQETKANQLLQYWKLYLQFQHTSSTELEFSNLCASRDLTELTRSCQDLESTPREQLPGYAMLSHPSASARQDNWVYAWRNMLTYLCGPPDHSTGTYDIEGEKAALDVPSDPSQPHPLRQRVFDDGTLTPITEILTTEQTIIDRFDQLEARLRTGDFTWTEHSRAQNILRGLHPDLRQEYLSSPDQVRLDPASQNRQQSDTDRLGGCQALAG
jgi:hypothetical protein